MDKNKKANNRNERDNERNNEQVGITTGATPSHSLDTTKRKPGVSMEEHREIESANAYIAEKEIQQTFHNS